MGNKNSTTTQKERATIIAHKNNSVHIKI